MMYILNQLQFEKKKTTLSSLRECYGIGTATSKKLNAILLNHPEAKEFKYDLNKLVRSKEGKNVFSLPSENQLRSKEFNSLLKISEIKTYRAFRQFQNLPSRGQRTHTNGQTSKKNIPPMFRLKINKDIAEGYLVKFKKIEYLRNGRSEEYNAFVKNEISKKKQSKNKYSKKEKDKFKKKMKEKNNNKSKKKKSAKKK